MPPLVAARGECMARPGQACEFMRLCSTFSRAVRAGLARRDRYGLNKSCVHRSGCELRAAHHTTQTDRPRTGSPRRAGLWFALPSPQSSPRLGQRPRWTCLRASTRYAVVHKPPGPTRAGFFFDYQPGGFAYPPTGSGSWQLTKSATCNWVHQWFPTPSVVWPRRSPASLRLLGLTVPTGTRCRHS